MISPTSGLGSIPRYFITWCPSMGARSRASSSCSPSSSIRCLEFVDPALDRPGAPHVAGGDIAPHQLVERLEEVAGITHVATHRGVGPSHLVGVGTQVEEHQVPDSVDDLARVAQRPQPLPGHPRPDHFVVVKAHPSGTELPCGRFADVVEEGGESEHEVWAGAHGHRDAVGENVLVTLDGVLFHFEVEQFGEEVGGEAGSDHPPEGRFRVGGGEKPAELVADPLSRDDLAAVLPCSPPPPRQPGRG